MDKGYDPQSDLSYLNQVHEIVGTLGSGSFSTVSFTLDFIA